MATDPRNKDGSSAKISTVEPEQQTDESLNVENVIEPEKTPSNLNPTELPNSPKYLTPKELTWISIAFTVATWMLALDISILATAIPHITTQFNSLPDVGWYGSAYLLGEMASQPTWGRVYTFFDNKLTYILTLVIFEIGSVISAAAPNSIALILGRTVSGIGGAGMLCGSLAIFGQSVPLKKRPWGMALVTSMYTIASLIGPTLGGLFTDVEKLGWRFCFWINLPSGALCIGITWWVLKNQAAPSADLPLRKKLQMLDFEGAFLLMTALVCLFLALTWGGDKYPWSNVKVYGCLIGFALLSGVFIALQAYKKEKATIPLRILLPRTVLLSCLFNFLYSVASITHGYYIAFYFQSGRGSSAALSGAKGLPYAVAAGICTLISGYSMSSNGYYVPFMWAGAAIYAIAAGLLTTLTIDSGAGMWVGYLIIAGIGFGLSVQIPFIAVQVVLPSADMPIACAWVVFFRAFGGAIGVAIAQNIFTTNLVKKLLQIPGLDIKTVLGAGAANVGLEKIVQPDMLRLVRGAYVFGVTKAFWLPVGVLCAAFVCSLGMERKRIMDEDEIEAVETRETGERATEMVEVKGVA
ncbi:hypothetical protein VE02_10058 [Pseudogymnoascus sp. 03VT05]|nr:hypothetical protein VE02_10058 [Pseudogymnoascus sp. 03VT05]